MAGMFSIIYSGIFTLISKDTDICIKARQYRTSASGSTDFRDHWCWESDTFDTGTV